MNFLQKMKSASRIERIHRVIIIWARYFSSNNCTRYGTVVYPETVINAIFNCDVGGSAVFTASSTRVGVGYRCSLRKSDSGYASSDIWSVPGCYLVREGKRGSIWQLNSRR